MKNKRKKQEIFRYNFFPKNRKGALAISQIFILIIGIIAISWIIGSEVEVVRGIVDIDPCNKICKENDYNRGGRCDSLDNCRRNVGTFLDSGKCSKDKGEEAWRCCCLALKGKVTNTEIPTNIKINEEEEKKKIVEIPEKDEKEITNTTETDDQSGPAMLARFFGGGKGLESVLGAFMWAGIASIAVKMVGPMAGLSEEKTAALSAAIFAGMASGQISSSLLQKNEKFMKKFKTEAKGKAGAKAWGAGIGVAVGVAVFLLSYRREEIEVIEFDCLAWDAAVGGENCEQCNKQGLPCSEYQCRSLGQSCELINQGTDEEQCVWIGRNDVEYPIIKPWENALLNDYEYLPDDASYPSKEDRGVFVSYDKGNESHSENSKVKCIPAFTPLQFGVTLDEPAKCKLDILRKENFDDMSFYFSNSVSKYNHSYALSLPNSKALEAEGVILENGGKYELYARCQDANGNYNPGNFVFKFCVDEEEDTTPPLIVATDPLNGQPVAYGTRNFTTSVYTNEPAECRWSHTDQDYDSMTHEMGCDSSSFNMNSQMLYKCTTILEGLKDRQDNKYYFRCKDNNENVNEQSYAFKLIGTQQLIIDWVKPEAGDTIKDSSDAIQVTLEAKTSAGYDEGMSACYYSDTGDTDNYVLFFEDENLDKYQHSQDLWLSEGDYEYFIKCLDLGGNSDIKKTNFTIESDSSAPIIVRAYHEDSYLKVVTNEPANCVYDTKYESYPCDYLFEDGNEMNTLDDLNHYSEWNTEVNLYIKCEDEYGIQPAPDQCSMIVRAFQNY